MQRPTNSRTRARLPGAAAPYTDELLYSVVARTQERLAVQSPKILSAWTAGSRSAIATPDLPSRLGFLSAWASQEWGLSLSDIALDHTALAYFTSLRGTRVYSSMLEGMIGTEPYCHLRLGICASIVNDTQYFRMCRSCVMEDMNKIGETYWRRSHQLPGVLVCPQHGQILDVTTVRFRGERRNVFVRAHRSLLNGSSPATSADLPGLEMLRKLSSRSVHLASTMPAVIGQPVDYRTLFADRGFGPGWGAEAELARAFERHFGAGLLRLLFRPSLNDPLAWLQYARHKPRRFLHPLQHLLVMEFLEATPPMRWRQPIKTTGRRNIYRSPELRKEAGEMYAAGVTIRAIGKRLGVAWRTATKLVTPIQPADPTVAPDPAANREKWLAHMSTHPGHGRAALRRAAPALFARLYRSDREWLLAQGPERRTSADRKPRVSWATRDERLAEEIVVAAARLNASRPLRRVSAHRVLRDVGVDTMMRCRPSHLPKAWSALEKSTDDVRTYQVKRLASAIRQKPSMPKWRVLRIAAVNPERFDDGGTALVAEAQRSAKSEFGK